MNGFSAAFRQATNRSSGVVRSGTPQVGKGPDRVVEEHDAEARNDRVEARRLEPMRLRVGADEACGRAFPFGVGPGGGDHRIRNVDADAAALRSEQPRDGQRCPARTAADVEDAAFGSEGNRFDEQSSNGLNIWSSDSCVSTQARPARPFQSVACSLSVWCAISMNVSFYLPSRSENLLCKFKST
jgi:hypothetical protein